MTAYQPPERTFIWEMATSIHWVYFLYFTVHAHEDRHGTGVLYQREWGKDTGGSIPKDSATQYCEQCDWVACEECIEKQKDNELKCLNGHELKDHVTDKEGDGCNLCGFGTIVGYSLNKNIGEVIEKHFPKPPKHIQERMYLDTAGHWNFKIAVKAIKQNEPGVYAVSDESAQKLAVKFNWNKDILLDIFKAFVKTAEGDKRISVGERTVLSKIAEIWKIKNSECIYSDDIEFIKLPEIKDCKRYEGGVPICPKCHDSKNSFMQQLSRYDYFDFTNEYYKKIKSPIDDEPWICSECSYSTVAVK